MKVTINILRDEGQLRTFEDVLHRSYSFFLHVRQDVTVGVECDRDRRVPQKLLNDFGVYPFGEEKGCSRMPQIMKSCIEVKNRFLEQGLPRAIVDVMDDYRCAAPTLGGDYGLEAVCNLLG